jgi:hypothetical protein
MAPAADGWLYRAEVRIFPKGTSFAEGDKFFGGITWPIFDQRVDGQVGAHP